jgi:protein-tyrosine phosphatase
MSIVDLNRFPTKHGELYYGRMPDSNTLKKLKKENISCIWNLAAELDFLIKTEKSFVPIVIHGNIKDYSIPDNLSKFVEQLNTIAAILKSEKKVFIHCLAGMGRSGMALAAIDILLNGNKADIALKHAKAATSGPETNEQKDLVSFLGRHFKERE